MLQNVTVSFPLRNITSHQSTVWPNCVCRSLPGKPTAVLFHAAYTREYERHNSGTHQRSNPRARFCTPPTNDISVQVTSHSCPLSSPKLQTLRFISWKFLPLSRETQWKHRESLLSDVFALSLSGRDLRS